MTCIDPCCPHEALANPRHACRYAGEPAGSKQAPAQPHLHSGSQHQPAAAQGSSPAMPLHTETDTASSESPSPAQSPVGGESQPGADQGHSPGAPPPAGADTAGSQASASFVAGPQASDVQVSSISRPWQSIWSWRTDTQSDGLLLVSFSGGRRVGILCRAGPPKATPRASVSRV